MTIFDFTFNWFALLSLLAILTNGVVIYLVITGSFQLLVHRIYTLTIVFLILWSASEMLVRSSANPHASNFWYLLGAPGWLFVSPLFLSFVIAYIGKEKFLAKLSNIFILFSPGFIFLYLAWATNLLVDHSPALARFTYWGWDIYKKPLFNLFMAWLDLLFIISFWLLFRYRTRTKDPNKRKQTLLVLAGNLVPVVIGSFTNGFLPALHIEILPVAVPLTTIMSVMVAYAILKYKLFAINPAMVVTNIVETMNEILVVFNPDHYIEFVNSAVERILGYKKEELINQHAKDLFGSDWPIFQEKVLGPVRAGKMVTGFEMNLVDREGKKIPVSFSYSVLKNAQGESYGEVGVATDIRKIHSLIVDITAERNKLTTVMQSIADGVLALDLAGNVTLVTPAALTMLGLGSEDILGKRIDTVLKMDDGDQRLVYSDLLPGKKLTKDAVVAARKNLRMTTAFGKQIFVKLTSSAIKEGSEVGLGAIITLNDISKEKELEEMKIDFVSMAAHELRTPLTAIRGYLSVLQEEVSDSLSREQNSFLDKAFISSSQLAALVENLLSVSKIERGAMKLEVEPTDWKSVLQEAVNNFLPLAKEKDVQLDFTCPDDLPRVLVDKFRISEVLSNLLANAIAYTKPGGKIEVRVDSGNQEVTTHVRDNGQGIPESALEHLFTKFFRVSGVLEQGSKGTGLGLYISKAIVDMHKGKIWVESKLGEGSVFSFSVPVFKGTADLAGKKQQGSSSTFRKELDSGTATPVAATAPSKPVKRFFKRKS